MSEYNVTTLEELRLAMLDNTGTEQNPTVINIMADLNFQEISTPYTPIWSFGDAGWINIYGNGHSLSNMQIDPNTQGWGTHNSYCGYISFHNANFVNLYGERYIFAMTNYRVAFYNCSFQGACSQLFFGTSGWHKECSYNLKQLNYYANLKCLRDIDTIEDSYINIDSDNEYNFPLFNRVLNRCYLKGTLTSRDNALTMGYLTNCVINFDTTATVTITDNAQGTLSVYNTSKMPNCTPANTTLFKGVTDSQLKDTNYLSSIGFDIIT